MDWALYGPKLAQVALTIGADDVDGVAAVDPGTLGARRSPLEEIRGNIRAAGLEPVERNGALRGHRVTRSSMIRLGAVGYLNARPLVYGLELRNDLFALRFDVPSKCAALLHEGAIDLGMIPSIEYLRGRDRTGSCLELGIISDGPVASVALFTATPLDEIRIDRGGHQLADVGRAAARPVRRALRHRAGVRADGARTPTRCCERCDAALLIGDPALFLDHEALGVDEDRSRRGVDAR